MKRLKLISELPKEEFKGEVKQMMKSGVKKEEDEDFQLFKDLTEKDYDEGDEDEDEDEDESTQAFTQ